jgi:hypothetical protein
VSILLVLTAGQSDVQIVEGSVRRELNRDRCASLHDEIEQHAGGWRLVDSPVRKADSIENLPSGDLVLCAPKLDAVLRHLAERAILPTMALVLETRRDAGAERHDPRFAGAILEARLREKGVVRVHRHAYLEGAERLENPKSPQDAVIRREVVSRLEQAVRECIGAAPPERIVVATTGGLQVVANLVEEIVRLHAPTTTSVDLLEVADGARANPPTADHAVPRSSTPDPLVSYQARRRALELVEKGSLLGAWAVAQPLHDDEVERKWTQVMEWLARFASSLPMPSTCDIPVLTHPRMAIRAALRVELALRAGDIPRAIHATVAFFEAALWDGLGEHIERHPEESRQFKVRPSPDADLVRNGSDEDRKRPFKRVEAAGETDWYRIYDDATCANRLAKRYLKRDALTNLGLAVSGKVRDLRNDVAHNEPTPALMDDARRRMVESSLWSSDDAFLAQPLVRSVLCELGEQHTEHLVHDLLAAIRVRLLAPRM